VPYNWHWFWDWGTGETGNNAIHEMDFCRWELGADYPTKATSAGGRYAYQDDWQFYDTQMISFEFGREDNALLSWEGKSCNPFKYHGLGRGSTIHGTKGTALVSRKGYIAYDMDGKVIKKRMQSGKNAEATSNTIGGGNMTVEHFYNFTQSIRGKDKPHSPMIEAHKSTLLCHLANISQKVGRTLHTNPGSGRIEGDTEAMDMWSRSYQPGWKPSV
jgi:predicted dehydrogenase